MICSGVASEREVGLDSEKVDRPVRRNLETRTRGAAELLFNGVPQILQQVEAVSHLPCLWRPSGGTVRVQTATVTADQFNRQTPPKPAGGRSS
jgi:hypothetical protein